MTSEIEDFLNAEMNKSNILYFKNSKTNNNEIEAFYKSDDRKFCTLYIDVIKKIMNGELYERRKEK